MKLRAHFARRFRFLKALRASLVAGALYDLVFALAMVTVPRRLADPLGVPLPGERFYLWLLAVLLAMLACLYLAAARDPRRYSAVIAVAIAGRALGAVAFAAAALGSSGLDGLWIVAGVDLAFAVVHGVCWWPLR